MAHESNSNTLVIPMSRPLLNASAHDAWATSLIRSYPLSSTKRPPPPPPPVFHRSDIQPLMSICLSRCLPFKSCIVAPINFTLTPLSIQPPPQPPRPYPSFRHIINSFHASLRHIIIHPPSLSILQPPTLHYLATIALSSF